MGAKSSIEWTEHTFNPVWGCQKVSEGCAHCYAEAWAKRTGFKIWGQDSPRRFFGDKHWAEPLIWNKAAEKLGVMHRVFCGSMCDILEDRPDLAEPRKRVFNLVSETPNLLWLFLSKRPENAVSMYPEDWFRNWPRNVMPGFTIENQNRLDERMPHIARLANKGARVFLSCEPLLSKLDWNSNLFPGERNAWLQYVDWIVAGGESGPGARPMSPEWIRTLRDDCAYRDDMCRPWPLPFLFKQWGEFVSVSEVVGDGPHFTFPDGATVRKLGKHAAGRTLDGRTYDDVPRLSYGPQVQGL